MRVYKKMLQQQLYQETGKIVLLKDLSNISFDSKKGQSRSDLDTIIKVLIEKYGMYIYYINEGSSIDSWQMYITVCPIH